VDKVDPVTTVQAKFPDCVRDIEERSSSRVYATVEPSRITDVVRFMFEDLGARLIIITCLESRAGMEILYHLSFDSQGVIFTLRAVVPMPEPRIDSISPIVDGAEYIEREIMDLFGVEFVGHPNPVRFLLADDWPEGVYPYRKEYKHMYPYRSEEELEEAREKVRRRGTK